MEALTTAQISVLSANQIAVVSRGASRDAYGQLDGIQSPITGLRTDQVLVLSSMQVAAITPGGFASLGREQVSSISVKSLAGLTTGQLASMSSSQVGAFESAQICALSGRQLASISPGAVAESWDGYWWWGYGAAYGGLSSSAITFLSSVQVGALTTAQLTMLS